MELKRLLAEELDLGRLVGIALEYVDSGDTLRHSVMWSRFEYDDESGEIEYIPQPTGQEVADLFNEHLGVELVTGTDIDFALLSLERAVH